MPKKAGLEKLIHLEHTSYKGLLQPRYLQFNLFKNPPAGGGEAVGGGVHEILYPK